MLNIPYFHQREDYTCGPASMKMVLDFFGIHLKEDELKRSLRSTKKTGTNHLPLIRFATRKGFYCYVDNDSTIHTIKHFIDQDLPVIVHYIEPSNNEEHYSVAIGYNKRKLFFNDPWNGKHFGMYYRDFKARWHGRDAKGWLMALSKKRFDLGKQYAPKR